MAVQYLVGLFLEINSLPSVEEDIELLKSEYLFERRIHPSRKFFIGMSCQILFILSDGRPRPSQMATPPCPMVAYLLLPLLLFLFQQNQGR